MWRWSQEITWWSTSQGVFSTYVEVILSAITLFYKAFSILHVCGGDPHPSGSMKPSTAYSPRMWRWSYTPCPLKVWQRVFSTYVEVILSIFVSVVIRLGILHVCGGDPLSELEDSKWKRYSPRMWRWSLKFALLWRLDDVFSTYVEVIPSNQCWRKNWLRILHVCGGDPGWPKQKINRNRYSPRMWRWSWSLQWSETVSIVFSTYVEVILL